jgi:hypothetical protein
MKGAGMNLPLLPLAFIGAETGSDLPAYEISLNRVGINSIEVPRETVSVTTGSKLRLNLVNRGAPIHITISSSNAGSFTDFFHENLYVIDSVLLTIPIRKDANEGFFDLEILSGYGVTKTLLHVDVLNPVSYKKADKREDVPIQPVAHGRPHLLMITMGIGLIFYTGWLYLGIVLLNTAAFITLITGVLYTWYRQQHL